MIASGLIGCRKPLNVLMSSSLGNCLLQLLKFARSLLRTADDLYSKGFQTCREVIMGQIIEYYIPTGSISAQAKWKPAGACGKALEFQCRPAVKAEAQPYATAPLTNWIISALRASRRDASAAEALGGREALSTTRSRRKTVLEFSPASCPAPASCASLERHVFSPAARSFDRASADNENMLVLNDPERPSEAPAGPYF